MKKIFLVILAFFVASCSHELDTFNENPNLPTEVTPSLLLTNIEVATFSVQTTGLARLAGLWSQQMSGTSAGQLGAYSIYTLNENEVDNEWATLYTDVGVNAMEIINKYGDESPYYSGIAKVILAINMGYATDFWNEVPFDDAFKGQSDEFHPNYQTQEAIYAKLQTTLDDAITDFNQPVSANKNVPSSDDLIYNGNVTLWKKAAYALKARYALRLTEVEGSTVAAQKALDYLNQGTFASHSESLMAIFPGTANSLNQWYAFNLSRVDYIKMGTYFVDLLSTSSDPRLAFYAARNTAGGYSGNNASNLNDLTTSNIGTYLATANKSVGIVTYAEAKFIEAEAKFRLGDATASTAFSEAVSASVSDVTGDANATFVTTAVATTTLENILIQKYIALFGSMEPYNDYRRTGYPALTPLSGATIPKRLPTPQTERLYNRNAVVVGNLTDTVWWDVN